MLTKEEYKKERIRMFDSLREEKYKGEDGCIGITCIECPLTGACSTRFHPHEAIEIVEKWGKEHPQKVKREKFFESFDETVVFMFADIVDLTNVISIERCLCDSTKWRWKLTFMCDEVDGRG